MAEANFGKHFQIIFEHSPVGIAILDFSGRILLSNRIVRSMLGGNTADLHSQPLAKFLLPDDRSDFDDRFSRLSAKANSRFDIESRYLSGIEERWCRIAMTHVGTGDFSPFIFGIIEDVSAQKNGEERLRREKETAEKATQTKSAFLANMSHEIRTPIHTITGMTELLSDTRLDDEQLEYADQIRYSADVLLGLINDILDFSKIESGKLTLEIIDCDLIGLFSEVVDMISLAAHKKNLEVVMDLDRGIPRWVKSDPTRIRQVLINLFNNAVKFTSRGEIVIRVRPVHKIGRIHSLRVEVSDTGIGIPEDKLEMLFQAFTQVDSSTTRRFGGTGLGLSISKSIIQLMNGIIDVESIKDRGSTFWFVVPLEMISDREEEVEPVIEESVAGQRVLVVDDNESSRQVACADIADWFRRVETASSGREALDRLLRAVEEEDPFHLVLVDLHMPGMDGWQFASEVKNNPAIRRTRLILMSPLGSGTEAKMKLLGWFAGYVSKPLKRPDLLDCILNSLSAKTPDAAAAREHSPKKGTAEMKRRASRRILVAEDHPVNQQLFRTILEKMGYTVLSADTGVEAVEKVHSGKIDLVFMDGQMPEMSGFEATELIRKAGFGLPIIAVTANAVKGEKEKCIAAGMNDYLSKPFKSRDLHPLLEKWLPDTGAGNQSRGKKEPAAGKAPPGDSGSNGTDIFDYSAAVETFMGKKDIVVKVVSAFRKKTEAQFGSMSESLLSGNWQSLQIESHGIKGGSWNLQAGRLGDAAAALESAAMEKNPAAAADGLSAVIREYGLFTDYLTKLPDFKAD